MTESYHNGPKNGQSSKTQLRVVRASCRRSRSTSVYALSDGGAVLFARTGRTPFDRRKFFGEG